MRRRIRIPSVSFFAFQDIITSVVGIFVLVMMILVLELVQQTSQKNSGVQYADAAILEALAQMRDETEDMRAQLESLHQSALGSAGNRFRARELLRDAQAEIASTQARIKRTNAAAAKIAEALVRAEGQLQRKQDESLAMRPQRDELNRLKSEIDSLDNQLAMIESENPLVFRPTSIAGRDITLIDIASESFTVLEPSANRRTVFRRTPEVLSWLSDQEAAELHFILFVRPGGAANFHRLQEAMNQGNYSYGYDVLTAEVSLRMREEVLRGSAPSEMRSSQDSL